MKIDIILLLQEASDPPVIRMTSIPPPFSHPIQEIENETEERRIQRMMFERFHYDWNAIYSHLNSLSPISFEESDRGGFPDEVSGKSEICRAGFR